MLCRACPRLKCKNIPQNNDPLTFCKWKLSMIFILFHKHIKDEDGFTDDQKATTPVWCSDSYVKTGYCVKLGEIVSAVLT